MSHIAKLFKNGRSQAVRLTAEYRFDGTKVYIWRDPETGDVIVSRKPTTWDGFFAALKDANVPADFLAAGDRQQNAQERDPFDGWKE